MGLIKAPTLSPCASYVSGQAALLADSQALDPQARARLIVNLDPTWIDPVVFKIIED